MCDSWIFNKLVCFPRDRKEILYKNMKCQSSSKKDKKIANNFQKESYCNIAVRLIQDYMNMVVSTFQFQLILDVIVPT